MFGCELPVVAYKNESFLALPELVVDGFTGMIFTCPEELSACLKDWFNDFSSSAYDERKNRLQNNIKTRKNESWEEHWNNIAKPFFTPA